MEMQTQASNPLGTEERRHDREVFLEETLEQNPKGTVSSRQEEVRKCQPGRRKRHTEGGGSSKDTGLG